MAGRPDRVPLVACAGALLAATLGLLCAPFHEVLREDALLYLEQAGALRAGDWTAQTHPSGWPLLLAGALELLPVSTRAAGMPVARAVSVLLLAACAFPVAALARRIAGGRAAVLAVLALATCPTLIWLGGIAYADPLFLLLATTSVAWAADSEGRLQPLLGAATLASLAWWTKANAVLLLPALLAYAVLVRRRAGLPLLPVAWVALVFVAVSLPHLVLRAQAFGSPFSYGENSKFFVDEYAQVWQASVPVPSLGDYLSSHTPAQWLHKFIVRGALRVGYYFVLELGLLWMPLLVVGLWAWARRGRNAPDLRLPVLVVASLLLGLVPAFDIFGDPRYMAHPLPFVFVIGAAGFTALAAASPRAPRLLLALCVLLVAQVPVALLRDQLRLRAEAPWQTPRVRDEWARWTVRHLPPPVAILEGGELLELAWDEARESGELPADAPPAYVTRRPVFGTDLAGALADLQRGGVDHLLVDSRSLGRLPYLRELHDPRRAEHVELVASFTSTPEQGWLLRDMEVFRIRRR